MRGQCPFVLPLKGLLALFAAASSAVGDGQVIGWGVDLAGEIRPPSSSALPAVEVVGGGYHTVVRRGDGSIECFGRNFEGQCVVPAGLPPAIAIVARQFNTGALLVDGSVRIWGSNSNQQSEVPAQLGPVRQISLGNGFVTAIRQNGTVAAWGLNNNGQCAVPSDLGSVAAIASGYSHTVSRTSGGLVRCWGLNTSGQCDVPVGLAAATQVEAGGFHTAALLGDGTVRCWGAGQTYSGGIDFGQSQVPTGLGTIVQVSCGEYHTLALRSDGTVRAWGFTGNLQVNVPATLPSVRQVSAGGRHSVALLVSGSIACWGGIGNDFGQCTVPVDVGAVRAVGLGEAHLIYQRADGTLVGRGRNSWGESTPPSDLGIVSGFAVGAAGNLAILPTGVIRRWGSTFYGEQIIPPELTLGPVTRVAIGKFRGHHVALRGDGKVFCWGDNAFGKATTPANLPPAAEIGAGHDHTLAVLADGTVRCWGLDSNGSCAPQTDVADFVSVTGGDGWSMGLRQNGLVRTWGTNTGAGQVMRPPVDLTGVVQVAAGFGHAVALKSDGTVRVWGLDSEGALQIPAGLRNVTQIAADRTHTVAVLSSEASSCANPGGTGSATVSRSTGFWSNAQNWAWSDGGSPQVPGALTNVDLGAYGSIASNCQSRASTLTVRAGSTLIVNADFTQPVQPDNSIAVGSAATLSGRIWLVGTGANVLPDGLDIPVLSTPVTNGFFDIIESTVPAPKGKFLTLVPVSAAAGGVSYNLRLLPLTSGGSLTGALPGTYSGSVVAAETMDLNRDGLDDLALAIDFGPSLNGRVQVLLATPGGGLGDSRLAAIPPSPTCLATGDADGDGWDDLVVGVSSDSTGRLFLGAAAGGGSLIASTVFAVNGQPLSALIVPPDSGGGQAVGLADIAIGSTGGTGGSSGSKVAFYRAGTASPGQSVPVPPAPTAIGRRGRIVVTGGSSSSNVGGNLVVNGALVTLSPGATGAYALTQSIPVPGMPVLLDVADIDGDGFDEVVTANASPQPQGAGAPLPVYTLFRGQSSGFGQAVPFSPAAATSGLDISLVNIDSDGDRDLVCVQRTIGTQSSAVLIRIDTSGPGGALTFGEQTAIAADTPILSARGNLDGIGGDDLYLVDAASAAFKRGGVGGTAIPLLGTAPACLGDVDRDGVVNGNDLALVLGSWGLGGIADIDRDGVVNGNDLAIVLGAWGACAGAS